jgi:hypothetical protein
MVLVQNAKRDDRLHMRGRLMYMSQECVVSCAASHTWLYTVLAHALQALYVIWYL